MTAPDHAFAAYLCDQIANEGRPAIRALLTEVLDEFEVLFA